MKQRFVFFPNFPRSFSLEGVVEDGGKDMQTFFCYKIRR